MKKLLPFMVLVSVFLSSCSEKIYFTQAIRDQYNLTPEEIRGIQFYVSDEVVLRKGEENENQKTTEDGKLIVESGKSIDQLVIKSNTRGGADNVSDTRSMDVGFDDDSGNTLTFGSGRSRNGLYTLQAISWENGRGKVRYGDAFWYAAKGSENAALLFKMKSIKKLRVTEKVAKGRKVK